MGSKAPAAPTRSSDLAGEYFDRLRDRFAAAALAAGQVERDLEMAGLRLRLRAAGEETARALFPPFEHLALDPGGEPDLTFCLFDTASSGVEPPAPPWEAPVAAPGTNPVVRFRSERACVLAAEGSRALTAAEPEARVAVFHLPDARRIPAIERTAPLREGLQLLMGARGRRMVHAGAVGREGRGALLVGRGGSGKSTLALSCALAGMEIAADDYVLLDPGPPPVAHAMQSTAKLTEDSAARLGVAVSALDPAGFEPTLEGPPKALVEIRGLAPGRLRPRLEAVAVVAPSLAGGVAEEPALRPISAAEALRAVAPSTVMQSGFGGAESLASLAGLVRRVPSYALELSPDPWANASAIEGLVAEIG